MESLAEASGDAMRLGEEVPNKTGGRTNKGGLKRQSKQKQPPSSAAQEREVVAKRGGVGPTTRWYTDSRNTEGSKDLGFVRRGTNVGARDVNTLSV